MAELSRSDRRAVEEARVRLASLQRQRREEDRERLDLLLDIEELRGIAATFLGVIDDTHGR